MTLDIEQSETLPFLDVPQCIEMFVYSKPIAKYSTKSHNVEAPFPYKIAIFRYFIKRTYTVCTENKLTDELNAICTIARKNVYNNRTTNKLILVMNNKNPKTFQVNTKPI